MIGLSKKGLQTEQLCGDDFLPASPPNFPFTSLFIGRMPKRSSSAISLLRTVRHSPLAGRRSTVSASFGPRPFSSDPRYTPGRRRAWYHRSASVTSYPCDRGITILFYLHSLRTISRMTVSPFGEERELVRIFSFTEFEHLISC